MRILAIVLGVLFGVPFIVTLGFQLYAAILVVGVTRDVSASMSEARATIDAPPSDKYAVENVQVDRSLRSGYAALVEIDKLTRQRSIVFNAQLHIRELLKGGEAPPAEDFQDVFANARAAGYAEAECRQLTERLASQCVVASTRAHPVRGKSDVYNVDAVLQFVQKAPLGDVASDGALAYREIRDDLSSGARAVSVMPSGQQRQRWKFYDEVLRQCDRLRRSEGNCAIHRVIIRTNERRGSSALEIRGSAEYSFLQPAGGS